MKCPACKTSYLEDRQLEAQLPVLACGNCSGMWINGQTYLHWVEAAPVEVSAVEAVETQASADRKPGKFCPECGHYMRQAKVGHGIGFALDRCGACGGFWLDLREWQALKRAGLHGDLHRVFSDAWQGQLAREERTAREEHLLEEKLGATDYAEIRRVKKWIEKHPHRAELQAYLLAVRG